MLAEESMEVAYMLLLFAEEGMPIPSLTLVWAMETLGVTSSKELH